MSKKYELVDPIDFNIGRREPIKLYRVRALRELLLPHSLFDGVRCRERQVVKVGELGGYIQSEDNLSHDDNCWVDEEAHVIGNARIYDDVYVHGNSLVNHHADIRDKCRIAGYSQVSVEAKLRGNVVTYGHSCIGDHALVEGNVSVGDGASIIGYATVRGDVRISDYSGVSDYARLDGSISLSDHSEVIGHSTVFGNVILQDHARVAFDAHVEYHSSNEKGSEPALFLCSGVRIGSRANIRSLHDFIVIGPLGSRYGFTTFYLSETSVVMVYCGCCNLPMSEFLLRVDNQYPSRTTDEPSSFGYGDKYREACKYAGKVLMRHHGVTFTQ
jgi:carbonic anhydrase/acetyltransferase-like protein (isoleucine patch superfamily)